jgi:hypothetical protein
MPVMGAWGSGSFENDTAMDWAADVQSVEDVGQPFERLKRETDSYQGEGELVIDADFACELLAAAEAVALLMGRPSRDVPEELAQRLRGAGEPDNLLFHQARNAVLHVMRNSELAELWEEAAEGQDENEWLGELTGLFDRPNPAETETWSWRKAQDKSANPNDILGTCAFCNGPIERQHLWGLSVHDAFDATGLSNKSLSIHLPCLNARMHHKHAIADLKFDPDNLPDLDKL